ncbi:MAG: GntR family transcriptional regulator [Syntrophomonadaceae bacterium]|nr:GntR family transcriptional regulator [Syntrophomonadaceae bacterium]
MHLNIDTRSSIPVYQQIVDGIKSAAAKRIYNPGDRIPTVREMASQLTINPNTIAKAYQKLEQEGVIVTMRSRGTFIAERQNHPDKQRAKKLLKPSLEHIRTEAFHLGMEGEELKQLVLETLEEWEKEWRDIEK